MHGITFSTMARKRSSPPRTKPASPRTPVAADLRERLGVTRDVLARLLGLSPRKLADLERDDSKASESTRRRLIEALRLQRALASLMKPGAVGAWLVTPNASFDNFKPLELVERGESDRLWAMVHQLESGEPF